MKKILITGFEPFGGETINSSWEAVCRLPSKIGEYSISRLCVLVVFTDAADVVTKTARDGGYQTILCVGQAGGRSEITPELVGINLRYAKIPDNKGNQPKDEPVIDGGSHAYFSTLPMRKITESISASGIPAILSYSAGAYVCNDLLYTLLARFDGSDTRVGFIHVPYSKEQGKEPSMELSDIVKALTIAIESLD